VIKNKEIFNNSSEVQLPIVIIGAGTVGLLLAHELMNAGKQIILIEAGTDGIGSFSENEFTSIGHPHNGVKIGRAKGVGGTTNLWGGQLAEFTAKDVSEQSDFGQPSWPISWSELSLYYPIIYEKLGFSSKCPVEPEKLSDNKDSGWLELFYTRWLKQPNFKYHFLRDLMNSESVSIQENTVVTSMDFLNDKCISVTVYKNGIYEQIGNFDKLILANGTIEICRLLLMAKNVANCPFSKNRWIGKYFQDHLNIMIGQVVRPSKSLFARFSNIISNGEKFQPKIRINDTLESEGHLGITGFFSFDSKVSHHIDNVKQFVKAITGRSNQRIGFEGKFKMFVKVIRAAPQIVLIIYNYVRKNKIYVPFTSAVTLTLQAQQISIARSEITISEHAKDELDRPKAIIDWQIDGREFGKIKDFCLRLGIYLESNGLGILNHEKWYEEACIGNDGKWMEHVSDVYHQAGGTIMSHTPETGVVDTNLKIHGTSNVFIAGACVMPTSGYANTTLTALALTMRLAHHLKN